MRTANDGKDRIREGIRLILVIRCTELNVNV
jgi:hypothetical protein